jgi:hypothetical protein
VYVPGVNAVCDRAIRNSVSVAVIRVPAGCDALDAGADEAGGAVVPVVLEALVPLLHPAARVAAAISTNAPSALREPVIVMAFFLPETFPDARSSQATNLPLERIA